MSAVPFDHVMTASTGDCSVNHLPSWLASFAAPNGRPISGQEHTALPARGKAHEPFAWSFARRMTGGARDGAPDRWTNQET